jgi:predicted amidohydrolase YtcJ
MQTEQPDVRTLLVAGGLAGPGADEAADPGGRPPRAILVEGGRIAWLGADPAEVPAADRTFDLAGATLQPGFVDAHVHLTPTGLAVGGLHLTATPSLEACLDEVRAAAGRALPGGAVLGSGWDETRWPERRPPSADELADASGGRPVILTRIDGHAAVIDRTGLGTVPLARLDGVDRDPEGRPTGLLRREAQALAWRWFVTELPAAQLAAARQRAVREATRHGITSVHEMAAPALMGESDFDAWLEGDWPIDVVPYWGNDDLDFVLERGLRQIGGDLYLDGSIGSRTAALEAAYADGTGSGHCYRDTSEIVDLITGAVRRRVQVALHCIGDAAVRQAAEALSAAARVVGKGALRRTRPRLEHCCLVPPEVLEVLAQVGAVASVQPVFDRQWGGEGGLYAQRLGADRAARAIPLRSLLSAGVTLALGSDSTVTPMDGWGMVGAAVGHSRPAEALTEQEALHAATLGGRHAARQDDVGVLRVGCRADLAAFDADQRCLLTMVAGRIVHLQGE